MVSRQYSGPIHFAYCYEKFIKYLIIKYNCVLVLFVNIHFEKSYKCTLNNTNNNCNNLYFFSSIYLNKHLHLSV